MLKYFSLLFMSVVLCCVGRVYFIIFGPVAYGVCCVLWRREKLCMCWKIIAIITENARNNTRKNWQIVFKTCVCTLQDTISIGYRYWSCSWDEGNE
jgi:hypothetical protein